MPDEVRRSFEALRSDTERGLLLTGPELRYQAARRRSRRTGLTATATAVLLAAGLGAGWAVTRADGQPSSSSPTRSVAAPAPSASGTPSPVTTTPSSASSSAVPPTTPPTSEPPPVTATSEPPTSEPAVAPKPIPDSVEPALLAAADAHATVTEFRPLGVPEFCPAAKFASQQQLAVSGSRISRYREPDNPGPGGIPDDAVYNTVGVYRGDGAETYLDELRRGVKTCATSQVRDLDVQFSFMMPLDVGDDSVLIGRTYEETDAEGKPTNSGLWRNTYIAAVRIGDAVTLIDCRGYENAASDPGTARALGEALAKRLKAWRG